MDDATLLYSVIGERIRQAREKIERMSQSSLARAVGMTRTSINNIENGRQKPPVHVLWDIAAALDTEARLFIPLIEEFEREQARPAIPDPEQIAELISRAAAGDATARYAVHRIMRRRNPHQKGTE